MKYLIPALFFLVIGCAKPVAYTAPPSPTINESGAKSIIEQVFMELPAKRKPDAIAFEDDFIWLGYGVESKSNGIGTAVAITNSVAIVSGSSNVTTKGNSLRIYYNSLGQIDLYAKRDYYIIRIANKEGREFTKITTYNEAKARKFIDALRYLKNLRAPTSN
tara:strand:- start:177 stop:662 length:486 start_codon:yes stop_codon:yes gene_type:complete